MKIVISKPPIYNECVKAFGIDKRKGVVFTFGDVLYNPDNVIIPDHLLVHESTHAEQQKHDETVAKLWWKRYIEDPQWRIGQEVEAYKNQYHFICERVKDKNARFRFLHMLCIDLASPMYGSSISYTYAMRRIRG
jgi:hypothetical protein